jgi:inhibitor of KinA sporulation pathway (predicted exonuclease)
MGFSAVDVGSFAMAELKMTREGVGKKTMPQEWFADKFPHTHKALDDAKEQGHVFCNMLAQNRGSPK